jgi:UDP-2,3-diacylglucosamine pyrophosphatase LpxH
MTGLFLSDLHLFSRRSIGQRHWDQNADSIASARSIVLGGDMFDFRWSQLGGLDATLDAAAAWLEKAIALNPTASWVYLLGNHDCHPRMQNLLSSISDRYPTFDWSPTFWRIGSNIFLHGDVLDGIRHQGGLESYRARFHDEHAKGQLSNLLYSAVLRTRLHGVVPRVRHTRQQTCRTLLDYLKNCETALGPEVQNIFFGHTHVPMENYMFDGFNFHNAGSGIRYLTFKPLIFETPDLQ